MAFSRNFTFSKAWVGIQILLHTTKIAEMNDSDIDLSEKSEIFKIASVEKKLQLPEVGEKSKKSEISRKLVIDFVVLAQKLSKHNVNSMYDRK